MAPAGRPGLEVIDHMYSEGAPSAILAAMANQNPFENLTQEEIDAARALVEDAGCRSDRAVALVEAVVEVAAEEALKVIAGNGMVANGVVDARVARLKALVGALKPEDQFPNAYELGVVFRITPSQARNVLGTYQARHSAEYREHMDEQIKGLTAEKRTGKDLTVWDVFFDDPTALDYAYDKLRRRGLSKTLVRDPTALTLTVSKDVTDRHGKNAKEILEFKEV
jgi:hypothetical protein